MIKPCGTYVLVEMEVVEESIQEGALKGFVTATSDDRKKQQEGKDVGTIRGLGPLSYRGLKGVNEELSTAERASQWGVAIGDRVEFDRYSGKRLDHPGYELFRLIPDNLIMATVGDDNE